MPNSVRNCDECYEEFTKRPALQAKVLHEMRKHGEIMAMAMIAEELEGEHENHG